MCRYRRRDTSYSTERSAIPASACLAPARTRTPARLNSISPSISPGHTVPVIRTGASGSSSCSTATISWKNGSKSAAAIGVMPSAANTAR